VMLAVQRGDIGQEGRAVQLETQAVDARVVAPDQRRQVEIRQMAVERQPRHLIDAHAEQLARGAVGGHDMTVHVDGHHRIGERGEQRIQLEVAPLARHQTHPAHAEHPRHRLEHRLEGDQLGVEQVGHVQVDGIAVLAAHLAASHVEPVVDEGRDDVAQDADAVLAVKPQSHWQARSGSLSCWDHRTPAGKQSVKPS